MKIVIGIFLIGIGFAFSVFANDANVTNEFLSKNDLSKYEHAIHRVEAYLTGLTTVVSDFTQVAPDGSLTTGKFYLQRPGKMRWQYNPPTPILMVSTGSDFIYYDYELNQVSHIPLDSTLIGFLAQDKIQFKNTVGITKISDSAGAIRITLAPTDKPHDGTLQLEFSDNPLQLRNMVITDANQQVTSVSLNDAKFGLQLDPDLFIFHEPALTRHR